MSGSLAAAVTLGLLSPALLNPALLAQQAAPGFRLVPASPGETLAPPLDWGTDLDSALAAARDRDQRLLLYFHAPWSAPARVIDELVFRRPANQKLLKGLQRLRITIDDPEQQQVLRRYRRSHRVPEFVLLSPTGRVIRRLTKAIDTAVLDNFLEAEPKTAPESKHQGLARLVFAADFFLRQGCFERADHLLQEIRQTYGRQASDQLEALHWTRCEMLSDAGDMQRLRPVLEDYIRRYGKQLRGEARQMAYVLLGAARLATGGKATAELGPHIDELCRDMLCPFPERDLLSKAESLFGKRDPGHERRAKAWVQQVNAATRALERIGRPAASALRGSIRNPDQGAAERALRTLVRLRLPETTQFLLTQYATTQVGEKFRDTLLWGMAMSDDRRLLPTLIRCAGSEQERPAHRSRAVDGIRNLLQPCGSSDPEIARALTQAVRHANPRLRAECLQAMFSIRCPLPLELLLDCMKDQRRAYLGMGFKLGDNALWIFLQQLGMELRDSRLPEAKQRLSRISPPVLAWLRDWHRRHRTQLRWDARQKRYRF